MYANGWIPGISNYCIDWVGWNTTEYFLCYTFPYSYVIVPETHLHGGIIKYKQMQSS